MFYKIRLSKPGAKTTWLRPHSDDDPNDLTGRESEAQRFKVLDEAQAAMAEVVARMINRPVCIDLFCFYESSDNFIVQSISTGRPEAS